MSDEQALTFTVDGQLIGELGERLVTRNHVALSELIKNAYDADSASVTVQFMDLPNSAGEVKSSIRLQDFGSGMTFAEVESHWMRIATANKRREPVSDRYGRPKTGNKGIGRFSCQRLAHELVLETVAKIGSTLHKTTVYFKWADFPPGSDLGSIPCTYERTTLNKGKVGTVLSLIGLRDEWTQRDFDTLRRSTVLLAYAQEVKRKGYARDPGFKVEINAPGFERGSGDLLEQLADAGWGRLKGRVDDRGRLTLELKGKYLQGGRKSRSAALYPAYAGLNFDISYFLGIDSYDLNRDRTTLTRKVLAEVREHCGVRVYFDNFRVFPYGELGDDWLALDKDYAVRKSGADIPFVTKVAENLGISKREAGLLRPRNENLMGRIFLDSSQAHNLQIKMNREGFVDTTSFRTLVEIVRSSIEWMAVHYAYARRELDRRELEEAEEHFIELSGRSKDAEDDGDSLDAAVEVLSELSVSSAPAERRKEIKETVHAAQEVIRLKTDDTKRELATLRILASTAPLLFTFSHEVSTLIGRLDTHASRIKVLSAEKNMDAEVRAELLSQSKELVETRKSFQQLYGLFGLVASGRASRAKRHYAKRLLTKLVEGTRYSTDASGITVQVTCDQDVRTPKMNEAELVSIMANLYTNAIKSTMANNGKRILIYARELKTEFVFEVFDSGVGLAKKYREEVLKPFVADPANKIYSRLESRLGDDVVASLGRGTGLGLSIVKGMVESHRGTISFIDKDKWAIGISVRLPLEG